jgi:chorismate dehydratase
VPPAGRRVLDLGLEWKQWTGLPFVFAVWQTRLGADADAELVRLHDALHASLSWFETRVDALAVRRAATFDLEPHRLAHYWRTLHYRLDAQTVRGLLHFYALAAELGEAPRVERLVRIPAPAS